MMKPMRASPRALIAGALFGLLSGSPAARAELPPDIVATALALSQGAAAALAPAGARIEVKAGTLDSRLKLAPCSRIQPYLPSGVPPWGATRVGLRCTQGAVAWNVFLPVTVKVWAPGVVAAVALPAGAKVNAEQMTQQEVDWAAFASPAFAGVDDILGRSLTRAVAAGQTLRQNDVQARQWFTVGETVRIDAVGAGFSVSAEGQALTHGVEGQLSRVRTDSGRVLSARPVGEKRVEIAL